jgi:hypothetical protein
MASLQNEQIDQSYQGLIKTADNTSTIPFPPQNLQFGDGTAFPIEIADLSAFGAGTSIALKSGTNQVAVDGTGFVIDTAGGIMTANTGTVTFKNGTYNFGDAGPATNVDFTNATVTGLPSGGGGLVSMQNQEGRTYYDSTGTAPAGTYRTWVNTTGYGVATANVASRAAYSLFTMKPGEDINRVVINVSQSLAAATGEIAFYDTAINADGFIYLNNRLQTLGTVDMSSTGWKEITLGTAYTVPTGLTNNTIAIVAFPSANNANFGGWSNSMAMVGQGIYLAGGIPYRALHMHANPGVSPGTALPATIGDVGGTVDYKASTSNPLAVMIN